MEQIVDCIDINGDMHIMDRLVNEIVQSSQGSTSDHVSINDVQKANVTHVEESQYDIILVFDTQGVCSSLVVPYKSRGTHNQWFQRLCVSFWRRSQKRLQGCWKDEDTTRRL